VTTAPAATGSPNPAPWRPRPPLLLDRVPTRAALGAPRRGWVPARPLLAAPGSHVLIVASAFWDAEAATRNMRPTAGRSQY
jgi:hypothetical protein